MWWVGVGGEDGTRIGEEWGGEKTIVKGSSYLIICQDNSLMC